MIRDGIGEGKLADLGGHLIDVSAYLIHIDKKESWWWIFYEFCAIRTKTILFLLKIFA